MVREPEFKSEDLGFEPLPGQGEGQFFLPVRVNSSCADLIVPDPPSRARHAPKFVRTLKIPYPSLVTVSALGLTAGIYQMTVRVVRSPVKWTPVSKVHAGSFHVSVIHRTLTWTT